MAWIGSLAQILQSYLPRGGDGAHGVLFRANSSLNGLFGNRNRWFSILVITFKECVFWLVIVYRLWYTRISNFYCQKLNFNPILLKFGQVIKLQDGSSLHAWYDFDSFTRKKTMVLIPTQFFLFTITNSYFYEQIHFSMSLIKQQLTCTPPECVSYRPSKLLYSGGNVLHYIIECVRFVAIAIGIFKTVIDTVTLQATPPPQQILYFVFHNVYLNVFLV